MYNKDIAYYEEKLEIIIWMKVGLLPGEENMNVVTNQKEIVRGDGRSMHFRLEVLIYPNEEHSL